MSTASPTSPLKVGAALHRETEDDQGLDRGDDGQGHDEAGDHRAPPQRREQQAVDDALTLGV